MSAMQEREGNGVGNHNDEDASLPKATVYKMISELLPSGVICAKETRDLLVDCCVEFIHLLSSEANDQCERANRKTIMPEHILASLQNLGFEAFLDQVRGTLEESNEHRKSEREKGKRTNKMEASGLTEEELQRQQEELFEAARLKFLAQQNNS